MRAVAAAARRRAVRDGDRQADTAHLLHSLLERDPAAREACDDGTGRIVRVLGYLVQRSIGYGMRWSGSVEDSGAVPVVSERGERGGGGAGGVGAAGGVGGSGRGGLRGGGLRDVSRAPGGSGGDAATVRAGGASGSRSEAARSLRAGGTVAWSPAAAAALRAAVILAEERGRAQADGTDLLDALVADPGCRAVEVLRTAGLDVSRYRDDGPVAS
ncbi:Clp protease N-terminal domain-containing protein [Actinacidiphila sp. DG2A-62]|uniref:Clp protease N-terminal domain-containing protein n=1 Tax=Actinacidiphila sp. DG2A-62 TaxID=3108821 RepID=UPI002DB578DF|nr:Clp protease N-terminal domain-containing protein [Actinacidiphila sp. DG2A-62]MEC3998570.1 Clp protease N-terminal domain-containing protein [Actinacidiphila sp. DG2A-62]